MIEVRRSRLTTGCLFIVLSLVCLPVAADGLSLGGAMDFGRWSSFATRYEIQRSVCAWSSTPDGFYQVIARTQGDAGRFELRGDLGHRIRFDVRWQDDTQSGYWERLLPGFSSLRRYSYANSASCAGINTMLQIRLSKSDVDQVPGGQYFATLIITLVTE